MAESKYSGESIEVLSGLDPVRKRPGMYTDTAASQPSCAGSHRQLCRRSALRSRQRIDVTLFKDGSLEVTDDGRGMPVDIHPEGKGQRRRTDPDAAARRRKILNNNYKFSGGLHGVGVSVVNALSKHLECWIKRGGKVIQHQLSTTAKPKSKLKVVDDVGKNNTGTTVRFCPIRNISRRRQFRCRGCSMCCARKRCCARDCGSRFKIRATSREAKNGFTPDGLNEYLPRVLGEGEWLPPELFARQHRRRAGSCRLGVAWRIRRRRIVEKATSI